MEANQETQKVQTNPGITETQKVQTNPGITETRKVQTNLGITAAVLSVFIVIALILGGVSLSESQDNKTQIINDQVKIRRGDPTHTGVCVDLVSGMYQVKLDYTAPTSNHLGLSKIDALKNIETLGIADALTALTLDENRDLKSGIHNFTVDNNIKTGNNIITGSGNTIHPDIIYSGIVGGTCNKISTNSIKYSVIVGGDTNIIEGSNMNNGIIVGGDNNTIEGSKTNNGIIVGGDNNTLLSNKSHDTIIIGGKSNQFSGTSVTSGLILSGNSNKISGNTGAEEENVAIITGKNNNISSAGLNFKNTNSVILAGVSNSISTTGSNTDAFVMIGGRENKNKQGGNNYSVIMGGQKITMGCCGSQGNILTGGHKNTLGSNNSNNNSIIGGENLTFSGDSSNNSTLLGGAYNQILGNTGYSNSNNSVISGTSNRINIGNNNSILSGNNNFITQTSGTPPTNLTENSIVGGENNIINSGSVIGSHNIISGGFGSSITAGNDGEFKYNGIFSGRDNVIIGSASMSSDRQNQQNVITGGINNKLSKQNSSVIISGKSNIIDDTAGDGGTYNSIMGGFDNSIDNQNSSVVIAGTCNTIDDDDKGTYNSIMGGSHNNINNQDSSVVIAGTCNTIDAPGSEGLRNVIISGDRNVISGNNIMRNIMISSAGSSITPDSIGDSLNTFISSTDCFISSSGSVRNIIFGNKNNINADEAQDSFIGGQECKIESTKHENKINFIFGKSHAVKGTSNVQNCFLGGDSNELSGNENKNCLLGGESNVLSGNENENSFFLGGRGNELGKNGSLNNGIIGGTGNKFDPTDDTMYINNSLILGGNDNKLKKGETENGFILGGKGNYFDNRKSYQTGIIGGQNNYFDDEANNIFQSLILGGESNYFDNGTGNVSNGFILGGKSNAIQGTCAANNGIIGGEDNRIQSQNNNTDETYMFNSLVLGGKSNKIRIEHKPSADRDGGNIIAGGKSNDIRYGTGPGTDTEGCVGNTILGGDYNYINESRNSCIAGGTSITTFIGDGATYAYHICDNALFCGVYNATKEKTPWYKFDSSLSPSPYTPTAQQDTKYRFAVGCGVCPTTGVSAVYETGFAVTDKGDIFFGVCTPAAPSRGCCIYVNHHGKYVPKAFTIQHPTDEERWLRHGCLEGPEGGVYYRGKDEAPTTVQLPEYATKIASNFTLQITPIGEPRLMSASEVSPEGKFQVFGEGKFHWTATGERVSMDPEPLKKDITIQSMGPYSWSV